MRTVPETASNPDWPRKVARKLRELDNKILTLQAATGAALTIVGGGPSTTFDSIISGGTP